MKTIKTAGLNTNDRKAFADKGQWTQLVARFEDGRAGLFDSGKYVARGSHMARRVGDPEVEQLAKRYGV